MAEIIYLTMITRMVIYEHLLHPTFLQTLAPQLTS